MTLGYNTRKRLALLILVVGMPVYIIVAATLIGWMDRPPMWAELLIYIGLGVAWAVPFRAIFRGIGQPDPELPQDHMQKPR